ncbi:MAG: hypothetical protein R3C18_15850 [Planctomycetaceae bacterium]
MQFYQSLDMVPIIGVFVAVSLVTVLMLEGGYRLGTWWQARTVEEKEGPTAMIVGSLLAIMGFLLAITMGMSLERFDKRRELVLAEANAIGTTYLRAGFFPEPTSNEIRGLLREYASLRVVDVRDPERISVRIQQSNEIHAKLWSITEEQARTSPQSEVLALFVISLNEMIDLHGTRVTAGIDARVPTTVVILLILGSMVAMSMVGYSTGLQQRRTPIPAVFLILVLSSVITLVVDLDRSHGGFLKVSQQALIDVQKQIGPL